VKRICWSI